MLLSISRFSRSLFLCWDDLHFFFHGKCSLTKLIAPMKKTGKKDAPSVHPAFSSYSSDLQCFSLILHLPWLIRPPILASAMG
jgi:hypothetical protein